MKIKIDKDKCIGCGNCMAVCPAVFELKNGKSTVKEEVNLEQHQDCIRQAINGCPVLAISEEKEEKK